MEIMPFQDFETNYDQSQWSCFTEYEKFPAPVNGKLGAVRTEGGFYCGDWSYPEGFTDKLTSGDVKKIVILGTMELQGGDRSEISLVDSKNNAGASPIQKLFAVMYNGNNPRLRSYQTGNENDVNTSRTITLPFSGDVAVVIDVDDDGKTGKATYYYNGAPMKTTADASNETVIPPQTVNLEGTKHIRLSLHNASTGYFDNVEAFALTADTTPPVEYLGLTTENGGSLPEDGITPEDSFALKFNSPIILGALENKITINGENVSMNRISLSADRRSVTVAAPFGGYRSKSLTVAIKDGGIQSYTGGSYAGTLKKTVSVQIDTNAHKTEIIPYQDFEKDADEEAILASGIWDKASTDKEAGDVIEARGGKLIINRSNGSRTLNKNIDLRTVTEGEQMVVLARMQQQKTGDTVPGVKTALTKYESWGATTARNLVQLGSNAHIQVSGTEKGNTLADVGISVNPNQWYDTAAVLTFHRTGEDNPTADIEFYVDGVNTNTPVTGVPLVTGSDYLAEELALFVLSGVGEFDDIEAYRVVPGEEGKLLPLEMAETPLTNENGEAITSVSEDGSFVLHFNNPIIKSSAVDVVRVNGQIVETTLTADRRGLIVEAPEDGWVGTVLDVSISADTRGYATEKLGTVDNLQLSLDRTGSELRVVVTSASINGESAAANVCVRNTTDETKKVMVLLAESTSSDANVVLKATAVESVELKRNEKKYVELSLSNVSSDSIVQLFVWESDNLEPVLEKAYILKSE